MLARSRVKKRQSTSKCAIPPSFTESPHEQSPSFSTTSKRVYPRANSRTFNGTICFITPPRNDVCNILTTTITLHSNTTTHPIVDSATCTKPVHSSIAPELSTREYFHQDLSLPEAEVDRRALQRKISIFRCSSQSKLITKSHGFRRDRRKFHAVR